jgi:hypothetical protein
MRSFAAANNSGGILATSRARGLHYGCARTIARRAFTETTQGVYALTYEGKDRAVTGPLRWRLFGVQEKNI